MRRIVVSMWTTLDGYVAGPNDEMDWLAGEQRMMEYETSLVLGAEALLLGRITYGDFAEAWPKTARDESEAPEIRRYAQRVDDMAKIVVSRSGDTAEWGDTTRIESLDAETVAGLKEEGKGDLVVYGSLSVIDALQQLDAIDEYHLLAHPTAIGAGKPLFRSATRLCLVSAEPFPSGVVLLRYEPESARRTQIEST